MKRLAILLVAVAVVGCGSSDDGGGFDYPEYSAEAGATANTIIENCGDVDPDPCRRSQMQLAAESLSPEDYLDVCYALVEKTGNDPELCP